MSIKNKASLLFTCVTIIGFSVAQPLYSLLENNIQYLIARYTVAWEIFILIGVVSFVAPIVLFMTLSLLDTLQVSWMRRFMSFLILFPFFLVWLGWIAGDVMGKEWWFFKISSVILGGVVMVYMFLRNKKFRFFIAMLSPAAFLFPAIFIFFTPLFREIIYPLLPAKGGVTTLAGTNTPPVVVVVLDEFMVSALLTDKYVINKEIFPHFSQLAEDATWFRNATANHDETTSALPILLTGRYPSKKDVIPTYVNFPQNMFTFFSGTHDMKIFEADTFLCPEELCPEHHSFNYSAMRAVADSGHRFRDLIRESGIIYTNAVVPERMLRSFGFPRIPEASWSFDNGSREYTYSMPHGIFLDSIAKDEGGKPDFYFLHANRLPHRPWRYMASGKFYRDYSEFNAQIPGLEAGSWVENVMQVGVRRYLEQVAFTDRWLGKLIRRLKDADMYDRSLIIITADHGLAFIPGESARSITEDNFHQVVPVPLFIKKPFQENGYVSDKNVESVDILPTIADIVGSKISWQIDGYSVYSDFRRNGKIAFVGKDNKKITFEDGILKKYPNIRDVLKKEREWEKIPDGAFDREAAVVIFDEDRLRAVDLKSDFIPALITGKLTGGGTVPCELAISINGKIRGIEKPYEQDGKHLFQFFVPEKSFINGFNKVVILQRSVAGVQCAAGRGA